MRRRAVLAATAAFASGPIAGCTMPATGHARLVGLTAVNDRSDPAMLSVRIRDAETGTGLGNYRVTVDGDAAREFDCEWPGRDPLVVATDLLGDDAAVVDSREYDTREVDAECTNVIVRVQSNDALVYGHGTGPCSDLEHRLEECEPADAA